MSVIVKMEQAYNCLENFRNNCENNEYKKLIDIFFPMLYQDSKHRLEISVGKKMAENCFQPWLSMTTCKFMVKLSRCNDEPQLIFQDRANRLSKSITAINLALIENLCIAEEKGECMHSCKYQIDFRYNNEIDYRICVVIEE